MVEDSAIPGKPLPLEPRGPDFPYYRGDPPAISPGGWLLVLAGVAVGFSAIVTPLPFTDGAVTGWLRVLAFVALPLLGLFLATPSRWRAIFGPVGLREVKLMFVFALLNIAISMAVGAGVKALGTTSSNAKIGAAGSLDGAGLVNFFAKVGVQLLGEELITLLPFLALLAVCHRLAGLGRNASVIVAWLVSAVAFGLIHLPTYDWNLVQCVVVIGSARLVLTWAYVWSKNIWVSTGAHIINDWALIAFTVLLSPLVAGA